MYNQVFSKKLQGTIKFVVLTQKNRCNFEDLFWACALSSPVTFLTGDHEYKSDWTRSGRQLRQQEIWGEIKHCILEVWSTEDLACQALVQSQFQEGEIQPVTVLFCVICSMLTTALVSFSFFPTLKKCKHSSESCKIDKPLYGLLGYWLAWETVLTIFNYIRF